MVAGSALSPSSQLPVGLHPMSDDQAACAVLRVLTISPTLVTGTEAVGAPFSCKWWMVNVGGLLPWRTMRSVTFSMLRADRFGGKSPEFRVNWATSGVVGGGCVWA